MKKLLTLLLAMGSAICATAQGYLETQDVYDLRPHHYLNVGYVLHQIDFDDARHALYDGKAEWGASVEMGTTYYLNRVPWGGMLRLGIDFSYLDVSYAKYSYSASNSTTNSHFGAVGLQVGPSLTCTPARDLSVKLYARYAPTFSAYASEKLDNVVGGYVGGANVGASVSWKMMSLGFDTRLSLFGMPTLRSLEVDKDVRSVNDLFDNKQRVELSSMRVYVGFRF